MLTVVCTNVYGGCNTMAHGDFFVQPNQFEPESDPEVEAPEEVAAAGHFRMVSLAEKY